MKKENIIISGIVVCLMLFIQVCGLSERADFENKRKQVYLSADANDIRASGLDFYEALTAYKNSGVKFVTVHPKTVADFEADEKIFAVTYSSLSINRDSVSAAILPLLEPYDIDEKSVVVISVIPEISAYLKRNLAGLYPSDYVIEAAPDENTAVFCFPKCESKDITVGYDEGELYLINQAGLSLCIEYPAYTYESEEYTRFFEEFINQYKPKFLILRNNENENRINLSPKLKELLRDSSMFLTVFENENQISNEKPYIYDDMKDAFSQRIVRGFSTDKVVSHDETKYMYRYYQWYNSVLERNTTFLNVRLLQNTDMEASENLALTANAVQKLTDSLGRLGYTFPDEGKPLDYRYNSALAAMCGGVILLVLLYIYFSLTGLLKNPNTEIYILLTAAASIIFSFVFHDSISKYYALLTMIAAASLVTLFLFMLQQSEYSRRKKLLLMLLCTAAFLITGAVSVTALLTDFDFFLGDKWFFGVKISLILPVFAALYNCYAVYANVKKPARLKMLAEKIKAEIKRLPRSAVIVCGVIFLLAASYYLIRTGKSELVLPVEDKLRKLLTDIFIIRPRLKEFMIGYPAFALFVYFGIFRKNKTCCMIFGIIQALLFTSVLNTFCHTFTPMWVSAARFFTGLAVGTIVSVLIIGILEIIRYIREKYKA